MPDPINKIKLPGENTARDIHDSRIPGVDTTPTSGSSNVITSGGVYTGLSGKAPLASPALTGTPTAPTAAAGTNTTQIATTAFVKTAFDSAVATPTENLKIEQKANQQIVFRKTNVDWEAKALSMVRIKGRTEAFNQLVPISGSELSKNESGITIVDNRDGSYTVSGTASAQVTLQVGSYNVLAGHTYLYKGCPAGGSNSTFKLNGSLFDDMGSGAVYTASVNGNQTMYILVRSGASIPTPIVFRPQLIDLTLEGLGLTTAAAFQSLHPLPYYAYNAGVLKNNAATGIKTTGFNQWDEQWEAGTIDYTTGEEAAGTTIRSKNYIPVLADTAYYAPVLGTYFRVCFYDGDKQFISGRRITGGVFTTPANAAFIKISPESYGTTYKNDICINLSDASRNGIYEPYWERTLALGLNSLACHDENNNAVTLNGLDGVGSSYDEAVVENGMVTKIVKRFAEVDLGSLSWSFVSAPEWNCFSASVAGKNKGDANFISPKYPYAPVYNTSDDKVICGNGSNTTIYIRDSSFGGDAAAFTTAMAGVKLRYELATPKVLTVDNPFPAFVEVDNLGTEKRLPEDTADNPQGPFIADIQYGVDSGDIVSMLSAISVDCKDIFWVTYNSTQYNDILAAYNAGKIILCNTSGTTFRVITYSSSTGFVFATLANGTTTLSFTVTSGGWSTPNGISLATISGDPAQNFYVNKLYVNEKVYDNNNGNAFTLPSASGTFATTNDLSGKAELAGSSSQDFAVKNLNLAYQIKNNNNNFYLNPLQGGQLALISDIQTAQARPQIVTYSTSDIRFADGVIVFGKNSVATTTIPFHDFFELYTQSLGVNPDDYSNLGLRAKALMDFLYKSRVIVEYTPAGQQTLTATYIKDITAYTWPTDPNSAGVWTVTIRYGTSSGYSYLYLEPTSSGSSDMQVRLVKS